MRIATWNISSGVDTNAYSGELFDKTPEVSTDDKCLQEIARAIISSKVDVVALQEVTTTDSFGFMEKLSNLTGMKYFEKFENSPGFLIKNTRIGIAVLSKWPIKCEKKEFFKNPNLTKKTEKGLYSTHDKAFMAVTVEAKKPFNLLCSQFLPFHRFNADILDYKSTFKGFENYGVKNQSIVCADFNVISGREKLTKLLSGLAKTHSFLFDEVTTSDGKRCDNIAVPKDVKVKKAWLEKSITPSDHYMCIIEI